MSATTARRIGSPDMVFARLHLPRPLMPSTVEALLVRLASDPTSAPVAWEVRSRRELSSTSVPEITYLVGTLGEHARWLRRTLHDLLPGVLVENIPAGDGSRLPVDRAAKLQLQPPGIAVAADRPEAVSRAVLSALHQGLQPGEQLVLQVVLGPRRGPRHLKRDVPDPHQSWWSAMARGTNEASPAVRKQYEQRLHQAGIATCIRIGVTSPDPDRPSRMFAGLLGGLSTVKSPGTFLRLVPDKSMALDRGLPPKQWRMAPSAGELTSLLGWPIGDGDFPGLPPLHPRLAPASSRFSLDSATERIVGVSNVPGDPREIGFSSADGNYHLITTGPTGSGKSTALLRLIRADIEAGNPVLVIDPKQQLIDDIIDRAVPTERVNDVVIIDPRNKRIPGFNPLDVGDRDPDVVVDGLLAVFAAAFAEAWGPRTQDVTHAGLLTLARAGVIETRRGGQPYTLLDLPRLFIDPNFRRSVIGHVADDPVVASFWAAWESMSPGAQAATLAAPSNKWRQYLMRPSIRNILGQAQPKFRLRDVFRDNKIVLVPLNDGLIGPITAQLLGGLIVAEAWAATLERAVEHHLLRKPASVWIDEVQNYLHLPTSLDDALNASRSMGVSWNLAHQFRAQMPPGMLAAVDSNARTKIVFRPSDPKDAAAYARMAPDLEAIDYLSLGKHEAYATIVVNGEQQPWCSIRTLPPPDRTGLGDEIRRASTTNYGAEPAAGSTEVVAVEPSVPVGRKRKEPRS